MSPAGRGVPTLWLPAPSMSRMTPLAERHPPGAARPAAQPPVRRRGRAVPGPGHWRQHRHLHADRPDPAAQAAGARARRAGDALSAGPACRQQHGLADALVSDVSRVPEARRAPGRGAGAPPGRNLGHHRRADRTPGRRAGLGQLLLAARRARPRSAACSARRKTTASSRAIPWWSSATSTGCAGSPRRRRRWARRSWSTTTR